MTRNWYIEHGYKMSSLIDETEISRAEDQVREAYYSPIAGSADIPAGLAEKVVGNLAFLLLLQRSVFLTRAGAKLKTGYNSQEANTWALLQQEAQSCHQALEELRSVDGVNRDAQIMDICKIYFKTNFFYV